MTCAAGTSLAASVYSQAKAAVNITLAAGAVMGGSLVITTCSSTTGSQDTVLAVGTCGAAAAFSCAVGSDDDSSCASGGLASTVTLTVSAPSFMVLVGRYNGGAVTVGLSWAYSAPLTPTAASATPSPAAPSRSANASASARPSASAPPSASGLPSASARPLGWALVSVALPGGSASAGGDTTWATSAPALAAVQGAVAAASGVPADAVVPLRLVETATGWSAVLNASGWSAALNASGGRRRALQQQRQQQRHRQRQQQQRQQQWRALLLGGPPLPLGEFAAWRVDCAVRLAACGCNAADLAARVANASAGARAPAAWEALAVVWAAGVGLPAAEVRSALVVSVPVAGGAGGGGARVGRLEGGALLAFIAAAVAAVVVLAAGLLLRARVLRARPRWAQTTLGSPLGAPRAAAVVTEAEARGEAEAPATPAVAEEGQLPPEEVRPSAPSWRE